FDEGQGTTTWDGTENNNDGVLGAGTCQPGTSTCPSWVSGKHGSALSFDGTDDYILTTNNDSLDSYQLGTVGVWFKTSVTSASNQRFVSYASADINTQAIGAIGIDTSGYLFWNWQVTTAGDWSQIYGSTDIRDGQWHHVVFVADSVNTVKIYLDGTEENTTIDITNGGSASDWFADAYGVASYTNKIGIGYLNRQTPTNFFSGQIDDVRIYNYARTQEQILMDYNAGMGTHFK
ncbi:hypothetical protein AMJ49_05945, partial [Parcubacteria bacterium DG_74_2]